MIAQLNKMGYETVLYKEGFVGFTFTVPDGRFKDQQIEVALQAPNFPDIPPSGPHFKPFLLPVNAPVSTHPYGGIHPRNVPTAEFQYWSRPFHGWDSTNRDMGVYLAFIRQLLDF